MHITFDKTTQRFTLFLSGNVINKCKYEIDTKCDNIFQRELCDCVILAVFKRGNNSFGLFPGRVRSSRT